MQGNILLNLLVLLLCSTAALADDVHYNYDRDANFEAYKTYQWADAPGRDPLRDRDICRAVDAQMSQKGLRRVESGGDLQVAYRTGVNKDKQLDAWTTGPRWSGMVRAKTSTVGVGTLVIHLYDPATRQLVWRGAVSKTLSLKKDPDKNYKNLEKAVARLLRDYPPKSKQADASARGN